MGALYEDVERFFGDIFASYGRVVARCPVPFVLVPVAVCCLLSAGVLILERDSDARSIYTPIGSRASKDRTIISSLFTNDDDITTTTVRRQLLDHAPFAEVVLAGKSRESADVAALIREISMLYEFIANITLDPEDGGRVAYPDVCARQFGACVVESNDGRHIHSGGIIDVLSLIGMNASFSETGRRPLPDNATEVRVKLTFPLRSTPDETRRLSRRWERRFLDEMKAYSPVGAAVTYIASQSIDIALADHVTNDVTAFTYAMAATFVYATLVGCGGNWVLSYVALAYAGVLAALLAIVGAFGAMGLCGVSFVDMCAVMPFLVLGIGMDNMFQLMTEWRQTNFRDSTEDRMASTLRSTAVSLTITSMTNILTFCIAATCPYMAVKNFCACTGIAVTLCYVNQLTFFSGCIVLNARRVSASRHCVTCVKTRSRRDFEKQKRNKCLILLCSGQTAKKFGDEGGICRRISKVFYAVYPRALLYWPTKFVVVIVFFAYIATALWSALRVETGLPLEVFIPSPSNLSEYIDDDRRHFGNAGPVVMFVVTQPTPYFSAIAQGYVQSMLDSAVRRQQVENGSTVSWLDAYLHEARDAPGTKTEAGFVRHLVDDFLVRHPQYARDVRVNAARTRVMASRFYVRLRHLATRESQREAMQRMRATATESPLLALAYSADFPYYENYVTVWTNSLLAVVVTMIGLLFTALVFIPHPVAVSCVTLAMVSVVVGLVGFLRWCQLPLTPVATIQVVVGVGRCVDSTVHASHAFMTARGKSRNDRVTVALEKVGVPMLNSAVCWSVCTLALLAAHSFVLRSFFRPMILVALLALLHAIVFLPVMLSFIGPRRTSWPRVYTTPSTTAAANVTSVAAAEPPAQAQPEKAALLTVHTTPPPDDADATCSKVTDATCSKVTDATCAKVADATRPKVRKQTTFLLDEDSRERSPVAETGCVEESGNHGNTHGANTTSRSRTDSPRIIEPEGIVRVWPKGAAYSKD